MGSQPFVVQAQTERGHNWMFLEDRGVAGGVPAPGGLCEVGVSRLVDSRRIRGGLSADIIMPFSVFLPTWAGQSRT